MRVATRHGSTYSAHSHRVSGTHFLTPGKWECNTISRRASWDAPQTLSIKNHTTSLRQTLSLPQLSIQLDYSRILLDIIRRDSPPYAQYVTPRCNCQHKPNQVTVYYVGNLDRHTLLPYLLSAHKPQSRTSPHMTPVMTTVQAGYGKLVQWSNFGQNTIQIIVKLSMNSPPILEEIHVINAYADSSFIKEDHSRRIHPNDPTRIAVFPAETDRGTKFEPFPVETVEMRRCRLLNSYLKVK